MFPKLLSRTGSDAGFTMSELLVVILVLGILTAIAVPTFLGQAAKADDSQAQSMARNAQTAADVYATDHEGSYQGASLAVLRAIEPTLGDASGAVLITITPDASGQGYSVTARSSSQNSFSITRKDDGTVARTCTTASPTKTGSCHNGSW